MSPNPTSSASHPITIIAHRGLHDFFPENSTEAFDLARKEGFGWVEFDVWASADGLPVIMHDEALDRTSEASGPIALKTSVQLARIPLKGGDFQKRCHVPVGLPQGSGGMLIEIKLRDARDLVANVIVAMKERKTSWMLQSFHPENVIHARSIDPSLPTAFLVETASELIAGIRDRWPAIHARHDLLDASTIQTMRKAGISVGAWTVNEVEVIDRILRLKPDRIITDDPRCVRRMIQERAALGIHEAM